MFSSMGDVLIPAGRRQLSGVLAVPGEARGLVLFAHSSRNSPRNRFLAEVLHEAGFGTLLADLLTPAEANVAIESIDVDLLADRILETASWLQGLPHIGALPLALLGADAGSAAALAVAAGSPGWFRAIVCRGGRPDLAWDALPHVEAPTLFVVGSRDNKALRCCGGAQARLQCVHELRVIPGATHLFAEPGALNALAEHSVRWLERYLPDDQAVVEAEEIEDRQYAVQA
jgi:putative phosphoribosyl transferase